MKKGQVTPEFFMFIGVIFIIAVILLSFIASDLRDGVREKRKEAMDDVGFFVQGELVLAAGVHDGYIRTFNIPEQSDMITYTITILASNKLVVSGEDYEEVFHIPYIVGNVQKGDNIVRKINGTIYLNT